MPKRNAKDSNTTFYKGHLTDPLSQILWLEIGQGRQDPSFLFWPSLLKDENKAKERRGSRGKETRLL